MVLLIGIIVNSMKRLPKPSYQKAISSIARGQDTTDIFPRQEHPDTRSAAKWRMDVEKKLERKKVVKALWYAKKKKDIYKSDNWKEF